MKTKSNMTVKDKIQDFLIKLLGGYRIIVGYFDPVGGYFRGSNTKVYPFTKHCFRLRNYTLFFDNKGNVKIESNKPNKKIPKWWQINELRKI